MTTSSLNTVNAVYRERLQQARRVMEGLSETERAHFNMNVYATPCDDMDVYGTPCDSGVEACIAGFCGFDPWFQEQDLITTVGPTMGSVSKEPREFFGTEMPFFSSYYAGIVSDRRITVDDALAALDRAIELFTDSPSTSEATIA